MPKQIIWMMTWFVLVLFAGAAQAQRVALVIGNGGYQSQDRLRNPSNDAELMARTFRQLGFDRVDLVTDADQIRMLTALGDFKQRAQSASLAVIYFSGHGMKHEGERQNYLLPIDMPSLAANASLNPDIVLQSKAVSEQALLDTMGSAQYQLLILDACRDNPGGSKSGATKGLARRAGVGAGRLIAYATEENKTARDGTGGNSPYAQSLGKHFSNPQLSIVQALDATAQEVRELTERFQQPMKSGDLAWNIPFSLKPIETPNERARETGPDAEQAAWDAARSTSGVGGYRAYLREYPRGRFADAAAKALSAIAPGQIIYKALDLQKLPIPWRPEHAKTMAFSSAGHVAVAIRPQSRSDSLETDVSLLDSSGQRLALLQGASNSVQALEFSKDGRLLLGEQYGGNCFVWSVPAGQLLQKIPDGVRCQWARPDAAEVVLNGNFGDIFSFDVATAKLTRWPASKGHHGTRLALDGKVLSIKDDVLWLWNKGRNAAPDRLASVKNTTTQVMGDSVALATPERVTIHALPSMHVLATVETGFQTNGDFASFSLLPSPNGKYVAYGMTIGSKSELRIWEIDVSQPIYQATRRLGLDQKNWAWSPDGNRLVFNKGYDSSGNNPEVAVFDVRERAFGSAAGYLNSAPFFSKDGTRIRAAGYDLTLSP